MEADKDRDGKISFEEFTKMVANTDVSNSMTLGELAIEALLKFDFMALQHESVLKAIYLERNIRDRILIFHPRSILNYTPQPHLPSAMENTG